MVLILVRILNQVAPNFEIPISPLIQNWGYQDVLDAPPDKVAEVIDGTLHMHPKPAAPHAWASSAMGAKINPPFNFGDGGPGGWWIVFEPELHLGEDIVVPDLADWRRETMQEYPTGAYFDLAPDWVCEVLSPSTRAMDLGRKRDIYAREGVDHLWFVDPEVKMLETFELRECKWVLLATLVGDAPVSLPPVRRHHFPAWCALAGDRLKGMPGWSRQKWA